MICCAESGAWLIIAQPAHAWLAGQLAANWGNNDFATPEPREVVAIATSLHDVGWQEWDTAPRLHSDGRPVNFLETTLDETREVWLRAIARVALLDPYAALLVSMHASTIYRKRLERGVDPPDEVQTLLDQTVAEQTALQARLEGHPQYIGAVEQDSLEANYRILRVCDLISLALCTGPLREGIIENVPGAHFRERVSLHYAPANENVLTLSPYPFSGSPLTVSVAARSLSESVYPDESAYHTALGEAPWVHLEFSLISG
jgi:hypothetical protein